MSSEPRIHPAALLMPALSDEEYRGLREDIRKNGLLRPILVHNDQVLDGRYRLRACSELDIKPTFKQWSGDDPFEYVWSIHMSRSLPPGTRAALRVMFDIALDEHRRLLAEQANRRRAESATRRGNDRADSNERASRDDALPTTKQRIAMSAAVSPRTAQKALTVAKQAPTLFREVCARKLSLEKAHKVVRKRRVHSDAENAAQYRRTTAAQVMPLMEMLSHELPGGLWCSPCAGRGELVELCTEARRAVGDEPPNRWLLYELRDERVALSTYANACAFSPVDFLKIDPPDERGDVDVVIENLPWPEPGLAIVRKAMELFPRAHIVALTELNCMIRDWIPNGVPRAQWLSRHMPDVLALPGRQAFGGYDGERYPHAVVWMYWHPHRRERIEGTFRFLSHDDHNAEPDPTAAKK